MMTIASIDITSTIATPSTISLTTAAAPVGEIVPSAMSSWTSDCPSQGLPVLPQPTPPFAELRELVADNTVLGEALQSLVDNMDVPVVASAAGVVANETLTMVNDGAASPLAAVDVAPTADVVAANDAEGAPSITAQRDDAFVIDCGRQGTADPTEADSKPSVHVDAFVSNASNKDGVLPVDAFVPNASNKDGFLHFDAIETIASTGFATASTITDTSVVVNDKLANITTPVASDTVPPVFDDELTPSIATQRDDAFVVDYGRQGTADPTEADAKPSVHVDAFVPNASNKDGVLHFGAIETIASTGFATASTVTDTSVVSNDKSANVTPSVVSDEKPVDVATSVDESDEVVLQAAPVVAAPVADSSVTPVAGTLVDSVAAVSHVASVDAPAMFVAVAQEIAAAVTVAPALMRGEAGEIRVQLKSDVLEGSEVVVAVDGKKMEIIFVPTVTRVADVVVANQSLVQQQLAAQISGFEISVSVAQTVATNVATAVGSAQAANVAVNRMRKTNGRA